MDRLGNRLRSDTERNKGTNTITSDCERLFTCALCNISSYIVSQTPGYSGQGHFFTIHLYTD